MGTNKCHKSITALACCVLVLSFLKLRRHLIRIWRARAAPSTSRCGARRRLSSTVLYHPPSRLTPNYGVESSHNDASARPHNVKQNTTTFTQ